MAGAGNPGIGVDAHGGGVIDPTANVKDLVEAEKLRADDLREKSEKYVEAALRHIADMASIRADHSKELREIESSRLNAIRQVDVLAVSTAADRALAAIQTLALQTTANADTLRAMVASTATTFATQLASSLQAITERIAALEKSSYEGKGRQAFSDPALADLAAEMRALRTAQTTIAGKTEGMSDAAKIIIGVGGFILTLLTIGSIIWAFTH